MECHVERIVTTRGKEENLAGMITFPCNEDDLKERFEVEGLKGLYFADKPDGKLSVKQFNYIMRDAEGKIEKLESQIDAAVKFVEKKMKANQKEGGNWKGISESVPLTFEDSVVWKYCMQDYKHKKPHVKVWMYRGELTVLYGRDK